MPVLFGGHNLPPLVEIGLTDLPKFGGAMAPPAPPGTTGLLYSYLSILVGKISTVFLQNLEYLLTDQG